MKDPRRTHTIPKGYRLKPSTHKLIKAMQKELKLSQEKVIRAAIKLYSKTLNFEKQ